MKKDNTIDKLWEQLKNIGEEEKEFVEVSETVANVISDLIEARNKKNMTQRDLARISNIKQTQIARVETLQTNPTLKTLAKYAYHVGATLKVKPVYENDCVHIKLYETYNTRNFHYGYTYQDLEFNESSILNEEQFLYEI